MPVDRDARYAAVVRKARAQRRQIRGLQGKLALLYRLVDAMGAEAIALREVARRPKRSTSFVDLWRGL